MLTGCGGSSDNTTGYTDSDNNTTFSYQDDTTDGSQIDMKLNHTYTVHPGDKIEKTSDDAEVTIRHKDGQKESTVTLISGSAILIRK